jgi:hypothetical protein
MYVNLVSTDRPGTAQCLVLRAGIVTDNGLDDRGSSSSKEKILLFCIRVQTVSRAQTASYAVDTVGSFPRD